MFSNKCFHRLIYYTGNYSCQISYDTTNMSTLLPCRPLGDLLVSLVTVTYDDLINETIVKVDVFSSHPCYLWNCYLVSSLLRTSPFPSPPLLPVLPLDPLFLLFFLPVTVQLQMSYKPLFYQLRGHSSVT